MTLTKADLNLPTHILQALRGDIIASNSIVVTPTQSHHKALNSQPVIIALKSSIDAIESPFYEFETHTLDGDNVHINNID